MPEMQARGGQAKRVTGQQGAGVSTGDPAPVFIPCPRQGGWVQGSLHVAVWLLGPTAAPGERRATLPPGWWGDFVCTQLG